MADVNNPGPNPEDPYGYTGKPPPQPPQQPPTQGWPQWQPPPASEGQPPRKSLWRPAIVGCIATVILLSASISTSIFGSQTFYWIGSAGGTLLSVGFVACLIMLIPRKTRRWAGGLLIGFCVGLAVALVIFAGVCVALIVGYDSGGY